MADEQKVVDASDIADTVGPAANYAIAKNFFNFEPLGPIDADVEVVDEIESFVQTFNTVKLAKNKNPFNALCHQILNFFAMKAFDANLSGPEMKIADYAILMVDTYRDIVENLSKETAYKEIFFNKWLPDKALPTAYTTWVEEIYNKGPQNSDLNKWIDKHAQKFSRSTKEEKLKVAFGGKLINEAQTAKGQIQAHHNRLYVPPHELASGKNMTAMFKAMKKQLLKMDWQDQGHNTLSRKAEWKTTWSYEDKARKLEEYREKKFAEWEEHGDVAFLPDYWLTFQLCSLPVQVHYPNKKLTLDCLVPPDVAAVAPMQIPTEPKQIRRAARSAAARTRGTASGSSLPVEDLTGDEESNTFTFIHKRERKEGPHVEAIAALSSELESLQTSVGLLAAIPGPGAGDAIANLTTRMVQIIVQRSALQQEQSEYFLRKKPMFASPAAAVGVAGTPASGQLSTSSTFDDPQATAPMQADSSYGVSFEEGNAFFAGQEYIYDGEEEDETDAEALARGREALAQLENER